MSAFPKQASALKLGGWHKRSRVAAPSPGGPRWTAWARRCLEGVCGMAWVGKEVDASSKSHRPIITNGRTRYLVHARMPRYRIGTLHARALSKVNREASLDSGPARHHALSHDCDCGRLACCSKPAVVPNADHASAGDQYPASDPARAVLSPQAHQAAESSGWLSPTALLPLHQQLTRWGDRQQDTPKGVYSAGDPRC